MILQVHELEILQSAGKELNQDGNGIKFMESIANHINNCQILRMDAEEFEMCFDWMSEIDRDDMSKEELNLLGRCERKVL